MELPPLLEQLKGRKLTVKSMLYDFMVTLCPTLPPPHHHHPTDYDFYDFERLLFLGGGGG